MKTNLLFAYFVGLGLLCLTLSSQAQNTLSGPLTVNGSTLLNGDAKVSGAKLGIDPTSNGFTVMEAIHLRDGNFRIDNGQIMAFDELTFHPDIDNNGDDIVRFLNSTGDINLLIDGDGRVGIGQSSDLLFSLNISDDNPFGTNMSLRNTTAGGKTWTMFSTGAANSEGAGHLLFRDESAGTRMMLGSDGNVGIGTTSPNEKLTVRGKVKAEFFQTTDSINKWTEIGHGGSNGFINVSGNSGSGNLDFRHDDVTQMSLTQAGNLGVGITNPSEKLEVVGNVKATAFIGDGSQLTGINATDNWDVSGDNLFNQNSGNVGIGVSNPNQKLTVNGNFEFNDGSGEFFQGNIRNVDQIIGADDIRLSGDGVGGDDVMINGDGNVGIGTSTPNERLTVRGKVKAEFFQTSNSVNKWTEIGHGGSNGYINVSGNSGSGNLDFRHDDVTQMSLTQAGNLGVGITNPSEKLQVAGNIKATGDLQLTNAQNQVGLTTELGGGILNMDYNFRHDNINTDAIGAAFRVDSRINDPLFQWLKRDPGSTGGGTEIMTLNRDGQLGIGTRNATATLDVVGNARVRNLPNGSGNIVVADAEGNLYRSNAVNNSNEVIENLQRENEDLKERVERLEELIHHLASTTTSSSTTALTSAVLEQNAPNPFSESTSVRYFIPEQVKDAVLYILDANGNTLKMITIEERGQGQIELQAHALSAGTYSYSLVLDGEIMETKQMVLTY